MLMATGADCPHYLPLNKITVEQFCAKCTINVLYALVEMQDFRCSILHKGLPSLETSCWCSSLAEIRRCVCTPFTRPYIDLCWAKVLFFNPYLPKSCWILEALLSDLLLVDQKETAFESLFFGLNEEFHSESFPKRCWCQAVAKWHQVKSNAIRNHWVHPGRRLRLGFA